MTKHLIMRHLQVSYLGLDNSLNFSQKSIIFILILFYLHEVRMLKSFIHDSNKAFILLRKLSRYDFNRSSISGWIRECALN